MPVKTVIIIDFDEGVSLILDEVIHPARAHVLYHPVCKIVLLYVVSHMAYAHNHMPHLLNYLPLQLIQKH